MSALPFVKLHGLGNDFALFDLRETVPVAHATQLRERAVALCDRHLGIGADGLLVLQAATSAARADTKLTIVNADGSIAQMCGNGIRCVAKYLGDRQPALRSRGHVTIDTDAGPRRCELRCADARVVTVAVEMGAPRPIARSESSAGPARLGEPLTLHLSRPGLVLSGFPVNMGNPHFVLFHRAEELQAETLSERASRLGPLIETHAAFPERTNVEFAHVHSDGSIELWVWERGCGLTLACGTGACATAVAARALGQGAFGEPQAVRLPGGSLSIRIAERYAEVWMEGPATEVYTAAIPL